MSTPLPPCPRKNRILKRATITAVVIGGSLVFMGALVIGIAAGWDLE